MKVEIKDGKTIVDCENTNGVIYPPNKCVGVVSFINCKNIVGVENNGDLYEFCKSKTPYNEYGKITLVEYVEEIFNEHKDLKRENEELKKKLKEFESIWYYG